MIQRQTAPERHYDPLWSQRAPKRRGRWSNAAIAVSIAAHAGLIAYIYETKFVAHYQQYSDSAITAELLPRVKAKPPAPPPEPPVKREQPPKADLKLHERPSTALDIPEPPTLTVPDLPPRPQTLDAVPQDPPKPPPAHVIASPNWSARPSAEDMARYYPDRAQRLDKAGSVLLQCQVTAKGAVADCSVLSEDPAEFGFGDAALKLARLFKLKPGMENGQAIEGAMVRIPIAFRLAG